MASTKIVEQQPRSVMLLMSWRELMRIALIGALVGLLTAAVYGLLDEYILTPTLCTTPELIGRCTSKSYFAAGIATILGAVVGLFALVQQRVFRPLLVVLLVTAGLWNVLLLIVSMPIVAAALAAAVMFAVVYATFSWLAQIRNFITALSVSILIVLVMRIIVSA